MSNKLKLFLFDIPLLFAIALGTTGFSYNAAPAAPELTVTLEGCSARLQIHDLSDNEQAFQLFRSLDKGEWQEIATLKSAARMDRIPYSDALPGGIRASYYTIAVNSSGQAESNQVSVDVDPKKCEAAGGEHRYVPIELKSFEAGGVEQAYCYQSLDDIHWQRWPAKGFVLPGKRLDSETAHMDLDLGVLEGRAPAGLNLSLECWGWTRESLEYLGKLHVDELDLSKQESREAGNDLLQISLDTSSDGQVDYKYTLPPKAINLPFITAWLTYDPQVCKNHLPANAQNALGMVLFCSPYPGYTIGANTANPQPYLVWSTLDHTCQAGFNDDCIPYDTLLQLAQQMGGKVGFILHQSDKNNGYYYGLPGVPTEYVVPLDNCPSDLTMTLQITFQAPQLFVSGPESNEVTIPCNQALGDSLPVTVTFQSIKLSNVDDGEGAPQDVELYGSFGVSTSSGFKEYRTLGDWNYIARDINGCPNEDFFQGFNTNGLLGLGCLDSYQNGTTSLANEEMCKSDLLGYCYITPTDTITDFKTNNNTITVSVGEGDTIFLSAQATDYDSASADDEVCLATGMSGPRTLFQWASMASETITLTSPNLGSGSCTIKVKIGIAP